MLKLTELIEKLQRIAEDHPEMRNKPVYISSNYGDRCGHEQVNNAGDAEIVEISQQAYSNSGWGIDLDDEFAEGRRDAVVIRDREYA